MASPSVIRLAIPADSTELWRLILQLNNENSLFPLSVGKVEWLMNRALYPEMIQPGDVGPRGIVGVIGPAGALEAFVFLLIGQSWSSEAHYLEEVAVYTDPNHRKSGHAKAMIQWMKDQATNTGMPLMTGIMSNHRTEEKCRLYRRMLPKLGELFFFAPKGSEMSLVATSS